MATNYDDKTVNLFGTGDTGSGFTKTQTNTTSAGTMPWYFVGNLMGMSLHVQNLEAGGSISLRISNNAKTNPPLITDDGSPHSSLGAVGADSGLPLGASFTWVKATKVQGGTPTATTCVIQGQIPK